MTWLIWKTPEADWGTISELYPDYFTIGSVEEAQDIIVKDITIFTQHAPLYCGKEALRDVIKVLQQKGWYDYKFVVTAGFITPYGQPSVIPPPD